MAARHKRSNHPRLLDSELLYLWGLQLRRGKKRPLRANPNRKLDSILSIQPGKPLLINAKGTDPPEQSRPRQLATRADPKPGSKQAKNRDSRKMAAETQSLVAARSTICPIKTSTIHSRTLEKQVEIHENVEQKGNKRKPPERPDVPAVQRLRVRFSKRERMKYVGHLELARLFLSCSTTRGEFSQHSVAVLTRNPRSCSAPPLQLGLESDSELVDFLLTKTIEPVDFVKRFSAQVPAGIEIREAQQVGLKDPPLQASVKSQTYVRRNRPRAEKWSCGVEER